MSIDVKTFEKSIEEVLNWIGEIEGRLETVEDDISQVDTNVSDLDYEVTEMRNEEVDSIKRINYFIDRMKDFFGCHFQWEKNDNSSKKMLMKFFDVYQK